MTLPARNPQQPQPKFSCAKQPRRNVTACPYPTPHDRRRVAPYRTSLLSIGANPTRAHCVPTTPVYIDDATSRLMHLQFVESESTFYFAATRDAYLERYSKPVAFL